MTTYVPITLQLVGEPIDPVCDPDGPQRWCVTATAGRLGKRVRVTGQHATPDDALVSFAGVSTALASLEGTIAFRRSIDRSALEVLSNRLRLVLLAFEGHVHEEAKRGTGAVDEYASVAVREARGVVDLPLPAESRPAS